MSHDADYLGCDIYIVYLLLGAVIAKSARVAPPRVGTAVVPFPTGVRDFLYYTELPVWFHGSSSFIFNGHGKIPYILKCNPHPFYSFRGLKNQMRIRIARGLDSRSWAGFWKNDRAAVRAIRTIQYNNLLFYLLFILHNILYNIYNLLFIRLAVVGWRKGADWNRELTFFFV